MSASRWVHLDVKKIAKETDAAFLLHLEDESVWVPKSQVADADDYAEGDMDCTIAVTEWFADKEGLA